MNMNKKVALLFFALAVITALYIALVIYPQLTVMM